MGKINGDGMNNKGRRNRKRKTAKAETRMGIGDAAVEFGSWEDTSKARRDNNHDSNVEKWLKSH